jgi:hypothetical protein
MALAYEGDNARSKRSYLTTGAFNSSIFQYTTQLNGANLRNEGRLTAITASPAGTTLTAANCPAGRILREVGRKLYPGVHPGLAVGDTFSGAVVGTTATNKFWVLVFDAQTGVRGFIDPNGPLFTTYNTDKSIEILDALENAGGVPTRLGAPVNTAGNVTLGGNLTLTNAFSSTANPVVGGSAVVGTLTLAGATPVVVNTTAVATTSKVFLSRNTLGGTMANFSITAQIAGSFSVTGTAGDTSTVNWLVINVA